MYHLPYVIYIHTHKRLGLALPFTTLTFTIKKILDRKTLL